MRVVYSVVLEIRFVGVRFVFGAFFLFFYGRFLKYRSFRVMKFVGVRLFGCLFTLFYVVVVICELCFVKYRIWAFFFRVGNVLFYGFCFFSGVFLGFWRLAFFGIDYNNIDI